MQRSGAVGGEAPSQTKGVTEFSQENLTPDLTLRDKQELPSKDVGAD